LNVRPCLANTLTPRQINYGQGQLITLNFENCMRSWTFFIGLGISLISIHNILLNHLLCWVISNNLWLVVLELVWTPSLFWEKSLLVFEGVKFIIISLYGCNANHLVRKLFFYFWNYIWKESRLFFSSKYRIGLSWVCYTVAEHKTSFSFITIIIPFNRQLLKIS